MSIAEQICFIFKCSNWHATFLIIHTEPLEGHHTHWKLQKKKKLWPMLMLMWFPFLGGGWKQEQVWGRERWGRESHGKQSGCCHMVCVCRLSWGEEEFCREVCVRKNLQCFSCSPQQVEALNRIKARAALTKNSYYGNPCHKSKGEVAIYFIFYVRSV